MATSSFLKLVGLDEENLEFCFGIDPSIEVNNSENMTTLHNKI